MSGRNILPRYRSTQFVEITRVPIGYGFANRAAAKAFDRSKCAVEDCGGVPLVTWGTKAYCGKHKSQCSTEPTRLTGDDKARFLKALRALRGK